MELRYLGFEQLRNARIYRFDVLEKGAPAKRFTVSADLALFLTHHVGIQEGPALSAKKLTADLTSEVECAHELTGEDLLAHAAACKSEVTRRAEARKTVRRKPPSNTSPPARWPYPNSGF